MSIEELNRRDFLRLGTVVAGSIALSACNARLFDFAEDERPNFVIIETDDQRYDTMQYMPRTQELIFNQGVTFDRGYITTPLCGPSRSSIFTGMYAHTHGVTDNTVDVFTDVTYAELLKKSGYYTGLVGKYSNTWAGEKRPEYDFWVSFARGQHRYNNALLNVNGEWIRHEGEYITYTFGKYVQEFLDKASKKRKPFCLTFTLNAPHEPAIPAAEDKYLNIELPERLPNFNEEDVSDKPSWLPLKDGLLDEKAIDELDTFRRLQILTLFSADRVIEDLINKLEEMGILDKTVIIFLSDNGRFWGEHRMTAKNSPYEEAVRVPFAMRYPPLIPTPYVEDRVVANIDIAPTLYELAEIPIPKKVDGKSLVSLFNKQVEWREGILIEGWPFRGVYAAYHTSRYVYVETVNDKTEFYDLLTDPYQMDNAIDDPQYKEIITHMKAQLDRLRSPNLNSQGSDTE